MFSAGVLSPSRAVTPEVAGRRSGQPVRLPIVVADHAGQRYLVSMLGPEAGWVRDVTAANGRAALLRRGREAVRLIEVAVHDRAPILRRYPVFRVDPR
ncbi:hypothetical protein [Nocardia jiangsuensis]|uniref:Deazaflavin-dependent oxidoreductase (Nitroreductase family) n=1 Tax=Nocardia jiangsuensis TaxID=1691563 RepID=A0ABV8DNC7_9NOCA